MGISEKENKINKLYTKIKTKIFRTCIGNSLFYHQHRANLAKAREDDY
jgi:hypothetical protein